MAYFRNFPLTQYRFGTSSDTATIQQLSAYVEVIDLVKDDIAYYNLYEVRDGERPDVLSQRLYGDQQFYWTFYMLNDDIRRQGWPLSTRELEEFLVEEYTNWTLTTQNDIFNTFKEGQVVTGSLSGATGTVIERNLDLGQIIVNGSGFNPTELITSHVDGTIQSATLTGAVIRYNSVMYYIDGDGNRVDVDPFSDPPSLYTPVTIADYYREQNNALGSIKILKREVVLQIDQAFQNLIRS